MLSRSATANASTVSRNVIANTRAGIPIQRGPPELVFAMLLGYTITPENCDSRIDLSMSCAISPVARPSVAVGDCQNDTVGCKSRVHNDEWKLVESISSAAGEINRPTMRSFSNCPYWLIKDDFESHRRGRTRSWYHAKAAKYSCSALG